MGIKLVVAVTDWNWFQMLRQRPDLAEVNFWAPSASSFKALKPGELFLFKLHAPRNVIVGGGVFAHANILPCSLAWAAFGEANGALSLQDMRARIAHYRKAEVSGRSDFLVGCRILTQPFFLDDRDWMQVPASWRPNTVTFKTYDTSEAEGHALWSAVDRLRSGQVASDFSDEGARWGEPQLVRPRLGQGAFRMLVTDIYDRRCAVSRERTLPALDAAHIRPYADGGAHEASNGLLLRSDIHSLFDAGYVTVSPDYRFEVSRRIREEFDNGVHYYALHGARIALPADPRQHPDKAALQWHNDRYRG
jgi:putative restriction endonuclease